MKGLRAYYIDDGILLDGIVIFRMLHGPVFFPTHPGCGWDYEHLNRKEQNKRWFLDKKLAEEAVK